MFIKIGFWLSVLGAAMVLVGAMFGILCKILLNLPQAPLHTLPVLSPEWFIFVAPGVAGFLVLGVGSLMVVVWMIALTIIRE